MKKFIVPFLSAIVFGCLIFTACEQDPDLQSVPSLEEQLEVAHKKLRNVNSVYQAKTNPARYFNGQKVPSGYKDEVLVFHAELVEYNSLNAELLSYVESLENENALSHQSYEVESYDPTKKYVEFATYYNSLTNKIRFHEIRIFLGDFTETIYEGGMYAKAITFDSTLTIDVSNCKNIYTGETVEYVFGEDADEEDDLEYPCEILDYPEYMNSIGEIDSVFIWKKDGEVYKFIDNSNIYESIVYIIIYDSVNPDIIDQFKNNACRGRGHSPNGNLIYDHQKYYFEYIIRTKINNPNDTRTDLCYVTSVDEDGGWNISQKFYESNQYTVFDYLLGNAK